MDVTLWIELLLFALLMALSGFFSSSETSLFSLNQRLIEKMRNEDNTRVDLVERLLSEPRRLIVTILIGNEFVNVAASVISAAIVIELFGAQNKLVNILVMVPILLLVGEITPKTIAIRHNVAFATFQSVPIDLFAKAIAPLRWLVRLVADSLTTLVVGKERARGSIVTRDMVRTLAREAVGDGVLNREEARYIDHIFDFGNKTLRNVMTARSQIFSLSADTPPSKVIEELRRTRRTKIPVYDGDRDNILGVLFARDLLGQDIAALDTAKGGLRGLLREAYYVPESKSVAELFHTFRTRRQSLAITVDEFGGVTGLVSMEDLLETIFGDIPSASDGVQKSLVSKLEDGSSRVDAAMSLEQFDAEFGTSFATGDAETVGGLVLHHYGEIPDEGTSVTIDELKFTVLRADSTHIQAVSVRGNSPLNADEEPESDPEPSTEDDADPKTEQGT